MARASYFRVGETEPGEVHVVSDLDALFDLWAGPLVVLDTAALDVVVTHVQLATESNGQQSYFVEYSDSQRRGAVLLIGSSASEALSALNRSGRWVEHAALPIQGWVSHQDAADIIEFLSADVVAGSLFVRGDLRNECQEAFQALTVVEVG